MSALASVGAPATSSLRRLDLAPLYEDCLIRSDDRRESYDCIASELTDYRLDWRGAAVDVRAYRARMQNLAFYSLKYGDEVAIARGLYRKFILVHVALKNSIEVEVDGHTTRVPEGSVFFSSPQKSIRSRWQEGCEQLLIPVPLRVLHATDREPLRLARSHRLLAPTLAPMFIDQLNLALKISRAGNNLESYADWIEEVEKGIARFVGLQLLERMRPIAHSPQEQRQPQPGRDKRERLESFIRARLKAPITLDKLTEAVGVGRTQLNRLCQEGFDCSPMALVRRMRLEAARFDLEQSPDQDFTSLSLRYGFEHQSRFAQYYRATFGELPRETKRRLRS
ncbi:AraC family transcriptional regulator [Bradyrhizobium sp. Pear77]|uniref:AraC family transcriptional regulator n=1 Tax=Bradyrhizobium altum TaxID=1571202 RepID=UPI001E3566C2|nr:AraC family transcriptional regulator [Bradyrhizobium altum]MCC8957357.1 AraC family transcriptional regulator [Bradyrhizobium altum]